MPLTKILLEFNVTEQEKVLSKILSAIGEKVEHTEYKKSGSYGDIFKVKGKNKVIKLTTSDYEAEAIEKIVDKNFDNVIHIYYAKPIPEKVIKNLDLRSQPLNNYLVVMEYLEPTDFLYSTPLSIILRNLSENVYKGVKDSRSDVGIQTYLMAIRKKLLGELTKNQVNGTIGVIEKIGSNLDTKDYKLFIDAILNVIVESVTVPIRDLHQGLSTLGTIDNQFIVDVINGLKELKKYDIFHDDLHLDNIMKDPRTGNYKIIDIQ